MKKSPGIFPLKPVITSDRTFARLYDTHWRSLPMISGCLSPDAAADLLDAGAEFDTLVLLNGEGEELVSRVLPAQDCDLQFVPRVERIRLPVLDERAVLAIHQVLRSQGALAFFKHEEAPPPLGFTPPTDAPQRQ